MAFLDRIRNDNLKENIGVLLTSKNENVSTNGAFSRSKKNTILSDVANTVNRNQSTFKSAKKSALKQVNTLDRTPIPKSVPKKNNISKFLFRDKVENSIDAKAQQRSIVADDDDAAYDGHCNHCESGKGIEISIPPTLTASDLEKLALNPFPRKKMISHKEEVTSELIPPVPDHDFYADIGNLPTFNISPFILEQFEFDVPLAYHSDSE